jgi:hypothetical protein
MVNFDSYVKNVLEILKVCGVPVMAMKGCCDDENLFPGADLYGSVGVTIADGFANALGHGDMYIFKGNNGVIKGVLLSNVSSKFLNLIKGNEMLYGAKYKSIKSLYSNDYVIYF